MKNCVLKRSSFALILAKPCGIRQSVITKRNCYDKVNLYEATERYVAEINGYVNSLIEKDIPVIDEIEII